MEALPAAVPRSGAFWSNFSWVAASAGSNRHQGKMGLSSAVARSTRARTKLNAELQPNIAEAKKHFEDCGKLKRKHFEYSQFGTPEFEALTFELINKAIKGVLPAFQQQTEKNLRPKDDFVTIDCCCGTARLLPTYSYFSNQAVYIDMDTKAINEARDRVAKYATNYRGPGKYPDVVCAGLCKNDVVVEPRTVGQEIGRIVVAGAGGRGRRSRLHGLAAAESTRRRKTTGRFGDQIPRVGRILHVLIEVLSLHRHDTIRAGILLQRIHTQGAAANGKNQNKSY